MMSAVPCIATLLELHEISGGDEGMMATGRVLLQNKLSLAYWGHLTSKNETGKPIPFVPPRLLAAQGCPLGAPHDVEWDR